MNARRSNRGKVLYQKSYISYCIIKIWNIYKIDLIATLSFLYEGSLLLFNENSKADNTKFNKFRSLGGGQYHK